MTARMNYLSVRSILAGQAPAGEPVTVRGWVRTRRDSKAGLSFVHVYDGSCFDPVQVVAPATLANYAGEVQKLTAGCAVVATGTLVPSPARASRSRCRPTRSRWSAGWTIPTPIRSSPSGTRFEYPARGGPPAPAHQRLGAVERACATRWPWRSTASSTSDGFFWVHTPIITASDAEGAGELFRVSTLDLAEPAAHARGQGRFRAGLLRQAGLPDRLGPAERRDLLHGAVEGLHLRPDVPRRELQHAAATWPSSG